MNNDKLLMAAIQQAGGGGALNVADVFSTHLHDGVSGVKAVNNGVNLLDHGGMVWLKSRDVANRSNVIYDTERGNGGLRTDLTSAEQNNSGYGMTPLVGGFNVLDSAGEVGTGSIASWTFRKAPKFFDVVTYTGDGTAARLIPHNLGTTIGILIGKSVSAVGHWGVYHKDLGDQGMYLNATNSAGTTLVKDGHSDTHFEVEVGYGIGNTTGVEYVAYLFAHDPSEDGMIQCGSFTTDGSGSAEVDLGWEPQYLLTKRTNATASWTVLDNMRGLPTTQVDNAKLFPDTSSAEVTGSSFGGGANAVGFDWFNDTASQTYIYMAIRAPMMKEPESGSEVFAIDTRHNTSPSFISNFAVDAGLWLGTLNSVRRLSSRLMGPKYLNPSSESAEFSDVSHKYDYSNGYYSSTASASSQFACMWKRAKGFFDVVAYTGNGSAGRLVQHSLGVPCELIITKGRNNTENWNGFHKDFPTSTLWLNATNGPLAVGQSWLSATPSESFTSPTTGNPGYSSNTAGTDYIAYLFATLAGISKVGSYTGNGTSQTIACGFTGGARFVLIKRTDAAGDWYVWDTLRGIVVGNDPHLSLNTTAAQVTTDDSIDPHASGFIANQVASTNINVNTATYIFYAIA